MWRWFDVLAVFLSLRSCQQMRMEEGSRWVRRGEVGEREKNNSWIVESVRNKEVSRYWCVWVGGSGFDYSQLRLKYMQNVACVCVVCFFFFFLFVSASQSKRWNWLWGSACCMFLFVWLCTCLRWASLVRLRLGRKTLNRHWCSSGATRVSQVWSTRSGSLSLWCVWGCRVLHLSAWFLSGFQRHTREVSRELWVSCRSERHCEWLFSFLR